MNVIQGIENYRAIKNPVLTVGSFDGVHLAHKALLAHLNQEAQALGGESLLVTFAPHPRQVLQSEDAYASRLRLLTTQDEKIRLLAKAGLQNVLFLKFDQTLADMPYDTFVRDILVGTIGVRKAVVGFNHSFGKDRAGGFANMQELATRYGFEAECFPEKMISDEHLSSTRIRSLLAEGKVSEANTLLGYNYRMYGCWKAEDGFCVDDPVKLLPADGNYLVRVRNGNKYDFTLGQVGEKIIFPDMSTLKDGDTVKVSFVREVDI